MDAKYLRRKERFDRNFTITAGKTLNEIKDRDRGYNLDYFYDCLDSLFIDKSTKYLGDKPIIGTFCAMVPDEIVIACGGVPVKLCGGNYIAQIAGDEIAPRDSCPVVKSVIGGFDMDLLPIYKECKLAIVPTSCDGKKKMAEVIADYVPTIPLHIPALKDESKFNETISIYFSLIKEIEKKTGNKLSRASLNKAIKLTQKINKEAYKFITFKQLKPAVITGTHAMVVINSYQYSDRERYLKELKLLNKHLAKKVKNKEFLPQKTKRILVTGSPLVFPNYKIPLVLEELGAVISADETCTGDRMLYDTVYVRENTIESMVKGLVTKCILPCSCPTFAYNEQRIYKLKQMIKEYKIDGIVYSVLRGCLPYDFEVRDVERLSEQLNIPVIRVETDYNTEDKEQVKIRLEAFVEMLEMKRG